MNRRSSTKPGSSYTFFHLNRNTNQEHKNRDNRLLEVPWFQDNLCSCRDFHRMWHMLDHIFHSLYLENSNQPHTQSTDLSQDHRSADS